MDYMLRSTAMDIAKEWKKYKGYTIRPLASTSQYYKDIISITPLSAKHLMYGSTPEIRSIFQELNKEVCIMDRSEEMIHAMGLLTSNGTALSNNEHVFIADWLSPPTSIGTFDLLIGDDAINMVSWEKFDSFLQHAYNMLHENGFFICHLLVKPDEWLIEQSFNDLVKDYRSGIIKSHYDLASRLNFICYDNKSYLMGWQQTIQKLGYAQLKEFCPEFNFVELFKWCNSQFVCPPQLEFERKAANYFSIEEIFYPHEHDYCMFEPVYVLRKRHII